MIFLESSEIGPINSSYNINVVIPKGILTLFVRSNPNYADDDILFGLNMEVEGSDIPILEYTLFRKVPRMKSLLTDIYCTLKLVYNERTVRAIERISYNNIDYFIFVRYNDNKKMFEFIAVPVTGIKMPSGGIYELLKPGYIQNTISVSMKNYERLLNYFFDKLIMPVCKYDIAIGIVNKGGNQ